MHILFTEIFNFVAGLLTNIYFPKIYFFRRYSNGYIY